MKKERTKIIKFPENIVTVEGMLIGWIVGINNGGLVSVDFPGNSLGPIIARTTTSSHAKIHRQANPEDSEVLLSFENNDARRPIIVDTMFPLLEEIAEYPTTAFVAEQQQNVTVDGKRVTIDAQDEIVLKCGKSSITLTKAGKVLIKGEYVLSHSSGENRMKGGCISIN